MRNTHSIKSTSQSQKLTRLHVLFKAIPNHKKTLSLRTNCASPCFLVTLFSPTTSLLFLLITTQLKRPWLFQKHCPPLDAAHFQPVHQPARIQHVLLNISPIFDFRESAGIIHMVMCINAATEMIQNSMSVNVGLPVVLRNVMLTDERLDKSGFDNIT